MSRYKKRVSRKAAKFAFDMYSGVTLDSDGIAQLPEDKTPKQRKKRVEHEILEHRKVVVKISERWPWPKGPMVISIRDERGQYIQGENQLQVGKKRPDIFIAKRKILTLGCKCNTPLIYSTLETHCHRCMRRVACEDIVFGGLFIEMKKDRNEYLTQKGEIRKVMDSIWPQYQTLLKLRRDGYAAFFAGGFDEAMSIAEWYMEGDGLHELEYLYKMDDEVCLSDYAVDDDMKFNDSHQGLFGEETDYWDWATRDVKDELEWINSEIESTDDFDELRELNKIRDELQNVLNNTPF